MQREGIDYNKTFSLVSCKDSFRIIMALVAYYDLELHQMDVKTCQVHKPGVPHGPASQQKLGPADDVANDAQTPGLAQTPKR